MSLPYALLNLLADGRFHSGAVLGERLGISRSAVWKRLQSLVADGVDLQAVRGKGYRLDRPLQMLDEQVIRAALPGPVHRHIGQLYLEQVVGSTSQWLLDRADSLRCGTACLAEMQQSGRGRRGRRWASPLAAHIYLSVLWRFSTGAASLSGLSLAMGVAIMRTLQSLGVSDAGLKWPNDVQWQGRKLAGILVDLAGEMAGPCVAVVGVGLNWRMPQAAGRTLDQPWVDLDTLMHGNPAPRSQVAGVLLGQLLLALDEFEQQGLAGFLPEWRQWDVINGHAVEVRLPDRAIYGTACGIDPQGALLVETGGQIFPYTAGEVSLRTIS